MNYLKDNFDGYTDEEVAEFLKSQGYEMFRKLPNGEWVMLVKLAFTFAVCVGVSPSTTYKYRWCFENWAEALLFYSTVKDVKEVPIHRESLRGHRYCDSPRLFVFDELGFCKW